MIEGGGLGVFRPDEIGPAEMHFQNGVIDLLVARRSGSGGRGEALSRLFPGRLPEAAASDPTLLRDMVPEDRQLAYDVRAVVAGLADEGSMLELKRGFGAGMVTALIRIAGRPLGLIANNPLHLGGAIDADAAEKAADFLTFCERFGFPVVSLCDTPGLMVGPDAEKAGQVRRAGRLFLAGAALTVPLFTIVLRKGYGWGAQAMAEAASTGRCSPLHGRQANSERWDWRGRCASARARELAAIEDETRRERGLPLARQPRLPAWKGHQFRQPLRVRRGDRSGRYEGLDSPGACGDGTDPGPVPSLSPINGRR